MDVSRIEAISPKQIDWRRLTAKEIIKYEQQGVDVPMQYLQWAQEFVNSIYSDDKTTYQMASSLSSKSTSTNNVETPQASGDDGNVEDVGASEDSEENSEDEPKTEAQSKREELQENGVSLRKQALVFTGDSKESKKEAIKSAFLISAVENASEKEIEHLETYMHFLLAQAERTQDEFKNEVEKINNNTSNKITFAKMNMLQQKLEKFGTMGQAIISDSENDLTGYETIINAQTPAIEKAGDFGSETITIGDELIDTAKSYGIWGIIDRIIGKSAVKAGQGALKWSEKTGNIQSEAISANTANLSTASAFKAEVESKTGVAAKPSAKEETDNDQTTDKNKETKAETKTDKDNENKTAQNDGTDTTDKVSTNIDEILKRKIRKGENVDNPTA